MGQTPEAAGRWRWALALAGLFLLVFALAVFSAPGRLDTIDAQNRYFVAQGIYERGHPSIDDEQVHAVFDDPFGFIVFTGRDGHKFSNYRLPHSALGAAAIGLADLTDVAYETRRYFFFSFINCATAGLLAVAYALWFRQQGLPRLASVGWAAAGIFCTPNWYFAGSSYDDLLGAPAVVLGLLVAGWGSAAPALLALPGGGPAPNVANRRAYLAAAGSGLLFALAFNCKEPLGVWIIPAYALLASGVPRWRAKLLVGAVLALSFAPGPALLLGYEAYKFPIKWEQPVEQTVEEIKQRGRDQRWAEAPEDESRPVVALAANAALGPGGGPLAAAVAATAAVANWPRYEVGEPGELAVFLERFKPQESYQKQVSGYMRPFPGTPVEGVVCLLVSPAVGMFWYCPPVLLGLGGLASSFRQRWAVALAMAAACLIFFGFVASIRFFKGDLSWGPRYLTPLFAVLWLLAPRARAWPRWLVVQLLVLGLLVQLLAVSVAAQRLYIQKRWFPEVSEQWETWFNLSPLPAQLLNRPVEIGEVLHEDGSKVEAYGLARYPTASSPVNHFPRIGPEMVRKYHYLSSYRFWWVSLWYIDEGERPADLAATFTLMQAVAGAGLLLLVPLWLGRARGGGACAST